MAILPARTFSSETTTSSTSSMPFGLKRLISRKPTVSASASLKQPVSSKASPTAPASINGITSPFSVMSLSPRTAGHTDSSPPPYSPSSNQAPAPGSIQTTDDSPYVFLTQFDTVFLIDDSGSMAGRSWRETAAALKAITPICTAHDADGVDVYFLNHRNSQHPTGAYTNVTTSVGVQGLFNSIRPLGGTHTGTRLHHILKPYLARVEESVERQAHGQAVSVKPLNIIVVTDGVPSDDVEATIVQAAKKLDAWGAVPWQIGIQFFQVGQEPEAAEALQELDDALAAQHQIRDMVDTVPWTGDQGETLSADPLLKVVLGSVTRRLDRKTAPSKQRQPSFRQS